MKHRALMAAVAIACLAAPASAAALAPAETFNGPGQRHAVQCVRLVASPAPLRFATAAPTGFSVTDAFSFDDGSCPAGFVRLDLHELIPSSAGPLAFHRGGNGYADDDNVKYGALALGDIVGSLPAPVPASGGRGAACTLSAEPDYGVDVRSIPSQMHYKQPQDVPGGSNSGASFMHYGDPGADQGDRHDIHYSYLLWSFLNVRGGGMVRTLLAPGQVVRACDVQSVTMSAWDRSGAVNGQVTARYVRTYAGSCPVYGWMVWSHTYAGDRLGAVAHAHASTAAPEPEPTPGPSCPVAAPAAAPDVVTGDPSQAVDGAWGVAGSVDPRGVPASYHFELGVDSGYGVSTPEVALAAADREVPVSAPAGVLADGTTLHYRLVASSTHGTSYGADRVLVTPAPPTRPAERDATPPPPPSPPSLSGLRVAPGAFRRARSRRGTPARIRYATSAPAAVALSFERRGAGVRHGGRCVVRPRHRRPAWLRRARRCVRWVIVPGRLRQAAAGAGSASVPFGGWVRGRALARGRYRLRAVPTSGDGTGVARTAMFTLR